MSFFDLIITVRRADLFSAGFSSHSCRLNSMHGQIWLITPESEQIEIRYSPMAFLNISIHILNDMAAWTLRYECNLVIFVYSTTLVFRFMLVKKQLTKSDKFLHHQMIQFSSLYPPNLEDMLTSFIRAWVIPL